MTEIVQRNEHLFQWGERARIERKFAPEANGDYVWRCYASYANEEVRDGVYRHPQHGAETVYPKTWVPVGEGSEQEMRAMAERIASAVSVH